MKKAKGLIPVIVLLLSPLLNKAQTRHEEFPKPKLVVGIVVDQMRNEYLYRYWERFGNGGFKRLVGEGFHFRNAHYNYIPTFTGPGHCSIYTGTTPRFHGIIGNAWYNKANGKGALCVQDSLVKPVGTENKKAKASPKNQLSTTMGDELRLSTSKRSKVFGIAHKDRSAILPAGHIGNAAFWMDEKNGNFVSSSWYLNELPKWMQDFNAKHLALAYLEKGWNTLYPIATYSNSVTDENTYEELIFNNTKSTFPYDLKGVIEKQNFSNIVYTPFGNSLTKDAAIACLTGERLGKDEDPDLLAISFSTPDIIGHAFGPRSVEEEDIYLRLDKDLEELLNVLDKEVGKGNYVVFLSADHGGADVANHMIDNRIPAGYILEEQVSKAVRNYFRNVYGDSLLLANMSNEQLFLNEERLRNMKLDKDEVEKKLCSFLLSIPGIAEAYPSEVLRGAASGKNDMLSLLQNGYNHKMSGNVAVIYQPGWMDHGQKGTTHGSGYNYDTHVPIVFYGAGIKKGESFNYVSITQIAPTICELLRINQPSATSAEPLNNYFK